MLVLNWDFPFGFWPTNRVNLFGDFGHFRPASYFCNLFFQSALGFFPAQEVVRRHLVLATLFSSGGEDTASVVAVVLR
jgi:hypothetical protein